MSGLYPDVPGHRMAYDRDGTVLARIHAGTEAITVLSQADRQVLNDEDVTGGFVPGDNSAPGWYYAFLFPQLRDLAGYLMAWTFASHSMPGGLATSVDTTNGLDGTWTSRPNWASAASSKSALRNSITSLVVPGIKAIRFYNQQNFSGFGGNQFYSCHLYGSIAAGETPDRLRLWHPTLDQEVGPAYFDWADFRQSSSADRQFRVKNESDTLTANTITLATEARTDTTPSVPAQHLLSLDGSTFAATRQIASLAPNQISDVVTVRRSTPSNAVLSLWWARVTAVAATWT